MASADAPVNARVPHLWDVFCRVVDNYGDAAVCWRLARQLVGEHGMGVRLWIDRPETLHALCPGLDTNLPSQMRDGVDVRRWDEGMQMGEAADIVIDAFGCDLPEAYLASMARRQPASLWIVLEYLSAEPWVGAHHGLPSPHPRLPLQRFFFFPGFVPDTGGLLREAGLRQRCAGFQRSPVERAQFWRALGFAPPASSAQVISLFGYENPAASALLARWAGGDQPTVVAVPVSRLRSAVTAFFGRTDVPDATTLQRGRLEARFVPFLPQSRYDELLWCCDWNFVRGEDSFVRAQWAARPLVWHVYPQQAEAHWKKLDAFLDRYSAGLAPDLAGPLRALWRGWNGAAANTLAADWEVLARNREILSKHALEWAESLAAQLDLAGNLVQFCQSKVK